MRALLVAPRFPVTYWGFQHALPYAGARASLPPLGLISVAALLPADWELRLVDTNVRELDYADLAWADVVLTGGMRIQAPSMRAILARAHAAGVPSVVGGPAPTSSPGELAEADVIFRGELEGRSDELLSAIEAVQSGAGAQVVPPRDAHPDLADVPVPRFDLLDLDRYASMSVQYSRGCPYHCEFCDVVELFGRRPRVKSSAQVLAELAELHRLGYHGSVFFVDDNFIGNRKAVLGLLEPLAAWQEERHRPFNMYTEASVNLAADERLLGAMTAAGFDAVFVGIETPSTAALAGAGKTHNLKHDLLESVIRLQRAGLEVMGGFIVGFDQDDERVFEAQRAFIAAAAVPLAMVGMLTALPGTPLERRLRREGRLREQSSGDQFARPNFIPSMDEAALLSGYAGLMTEIYGADAYYQRVQTFVDRAGRVPHRPVAPAQAAALVRAIVGIGVLSRRRKHFWRLFAHTARRAPHNLVRAVTHAIMGEHMIRYTDEELLPRIRRAQAAGRAERAAVASEPTQAELRAS